MEKPLTGKVPRYEDNRMAQIAAGASVPDLANAKRPG